MSKKVQILVFMIHTDEKNLEKSETIVLLTAHESITFSFYTNS